MTSQRKFGIWLRVLPAAIALSGFSGCKPGTSTISKEDKVSADAPDVTPTSQPSAATESGERVQRIPSSMRVGRQPADAADLERKFFATNESGERGAVAEELWSLNTVAALTTLHRLLNADANADVKVEIISGLVDAEANPETREIRWALLLAGLGANQPGPVRELAAAILSDADDPRALPLLQTFANDPDEEVREAVRSGLRERRESLSP